MEVCYSGVYLVELNRNFPIFSVNRKGQLMQYLQWTSGLILESLRKALRILFEPVHEKNNN